MRLTEARKVFSRCQLKGLDGFAIAKHCWADYPERKFTRAEVLNLLLGKGHLKTNSFPSAKNGSFLWHCKDKHDNNTQICVIVDGEKVIAFAISAYRSIK